MDENGNYIVTEVDIGSEYSGSFDIDQLNEGLDDNANELDNSNYTVIDPSDNQISDETTSQINADVPTNSKPLLLTIVNGLCGVVQATLERVDNVCMVLGNELEIIL